MAAKQNLRQALTLARKLGAVPQVVQAVKSFGELFGLQGQKDRALLLLGAVLAHPATDSDTRVEVDRVLESIGLTRETAEPDLARGKAVDFETVVRDLLSQ